MYPYVYILRFGDKQYVYYAYEATQYVSCLQLLTQYTYCVREVRNMYNIIWLDICG